MKRKTFRLLDLPPELWSRICKLVVIRDCTFFLKNPGSVHVTCESTQQPPITRTCWSLRNEALPTFYRRNVFVIVDRDSELLGLHKWLRGLGSDKRRLLTQLYVASEQHDDGPPFFDGMCEFSAYKAKLQPEERDACHWGNYTKIHRVMWTEQ